MSTAPGTALARPVPPELLSAPPIEARGGRRDAARLLVVAGDEAPVDVTMADLPRHLRPGDLLVVNLSATLPAALDAGDGLLAHLATPLPGGDWLVELRRRCRAGSTPVAVTPAGDELRLAGGARLELLAPATRRRGGGVRLWRGRVQVDGTVEGHLLRHGTPIRYGCPEARWPLAAYQTVFAAMPGSAEMPSAGRGFTLGLLARLAREGIATAPIVLHTGVSSQEAGEPPAPERYWVPEATARRVASTRAAAGAGEADHIVDPATGVRAVDGILTGWHEPEASHLLLLEAVAGREPLERAYGAAHALGHLWHEFGDFALLLPEPVRHPAPARTAVPAAVRRREGRGPRRASRMPSRARCAGEARVPPAPASGTGRASRAPAPVWSTPSAREPVS